MKKFVLDTSALFAFTDGEEGSDVVADLLRQACEERIGLLVSFASWMEMYYIYLQEQGKDEAEHWLAILKGLPLKRVESSEELGMVAGELKAKHRLSFADAWIAALSKKREATLVHKDPEFESIAAEVTLMTLPYKSGGP